MNQNPYLNICRYLPMDDIKAVISNPEIKFVSFDIFDTLLVRPSMIPTDIFYLLDHLFPESKKRFSELRISAEEQMKCPNATLSEIWSFILKRYHMDPDTVDDMLQKEIALETRLLTVRKDIYDVYRFAVEQGKQVIAVSDMYLPSDLLLKILHDKGYTNIHHVYVSCEYKKRKDSGELYSLVLEKERPLEPAQVVHIGDNYSSDYLKALECGVTAIYYPSVWDIVLGENSWWRKVFPDTHISDDPFTRLIFSFTFLFAYNAGYRLGENECFGTLDNFIMLCLAPLSVSVALDMVTNKAIQGEYKKIWFAARDGYLPMLVYKEITKNIPAIPAEYLYVSRSSLAYGRYKDFFDFFDRFEPATAYSLQSFLENFIVDPSLCKKICASLSASEAACDLSKNAELGREALLKFKSALNEYFSRQKELSRRYYMGIFHGIGERQLVFDCGYSGSVSDGLMSVCEKLPIDKYYLWQTEENIKRDRANGTKTFCRFKANTPFGLNLIIEECFSPAQGTHLGFTGRDGAVLPALEELSFSEELQNDIASIKGTILSYTEGFANVFQDYYGAFSSAREDVFSGILRYVFLEAQTAELRIFNNFKFPDGYTRGKNDVLPIKVQDYFDRSMQYRTPFSGTGFLLKENYIHIPERKLCSEAKKLKLGIHVHLYNKYLFPEVYGYLKSFPSRFDLFLTVTDEKFVPVAKNVFHANSLKNLGELHVLLVENRGRDIAPWLVDTARYQTDYDLFCHLHGKESAQYDPNVGRNWRDFLFVNLLDRQAAEDILNLFAADEKLGIVFPECFTCISDVFVNNKLNLLATMGEAEMTLVFGLLRRMGLGSAIDRSSILYSVGTMMWYRPEALKPLFGLNLATADFPEEPIDVGGTIAHSVERLPALAAQKEGYHARFFTEYPIEHRTWLERQTELFEASAHMHVNAQIGLKETLKIFINKHIPFLFRDCAEIRYENPIGFRKALEIFLTKCIHRFLRT